jgi:hypothetical protein
MVTTSDLPDYFEACTNMSRDEINNWICTNFPFTVLDAVTLDKLTYWGLLSPLKRKSFDPLTVDPSLTEL